MRRLLALSLLLATCHAGAAIAASPASAPASHPAAAAADPWLDAAQEDLRTIAKRPAADAPREFEIPGGPELAMMLAQHRGDQGDRALLRDMLERVREIVPRGKGMDDAAFNASILVTTAGLTLRLDDPDAADAVAAARRKVKGLPEGWVRLGLGAALSWWAAEAGDYDQAVAIANEGGRLPGGPASAFLNLSLVFAGDGRFDLRDRALRAAFNLTEALPESERDSAYRDIARTQATLRLLDEAMATARLCKTSWQASDCYIAIAEAAVADGDMAQAERALSAALRAVEGGGSVVMSNARRVAGIAERLGARDAFMVSAAVAEQRAGPSEHSILPALARGYAAFGKLDDFRRLVGRTHAAIAALPVDPDSRARPESLLQLASAHARAGEDDAVDRLIARAGLSPEQHAVADYFSQIPSAYAARSDLGRALAIIETHLKPEDRWFDYRALAEDAARAGAFDLALDVAARMKANFHQQRTYRFIARAQTRAGDPAQVAAWVRDLASPHARAAVRLGVAEQVLGVRPHMSVRLYEE